MFSALQCYSITTDKCYRRSTQRFCLLSRQTNLLTAQWSAVSSDPKIVPNHQFYHCFFSNIMVFTITTVTKQICVFILFQNTVSLGCFPSHICHCVSIYPNPHHGINRLYWINLNENNNPSEKIHYNQINPICWHVRVISRSIMQHVFKESLLDIILI